MNLHELLETVLQRGLLTPSRVPPMRTAIKQYTMILGVDAAHCPPEVYHLSPHALTELINAKAPATLGTSALRNLKNNLRWLLRQGEALHLIAPLEMPLKGWRDVQHFGKRWKPKRGEQSPAPHRAFWLRPLPPPLSDEFQAFSAWSTAPYSPDRPARVKKRPRTMAGYECTLWRLAGFAHHIEGMPAESLTLSDLTEPIFIQRYTAWWTAKREKVTTTIHHDLANLHVVAKYWLNDESRAAALRKIEAELAHPESVYDKRARWLSLKELEAAGLSQYPLNARRVTEYRRAKVFAKQLATKQPPTIKGRSGRMTALYVSYSLMLRLLVRIPLRQRNLRETQLDRNLRKSGGTWQITFKGDELKVGWRGGRLHQVTYDFPTELQPLLEEWLTYWRPLLLTNAPVKEVFLNMKGQPHSVFSICNAISSTTWRFSGVAVNPHTIRDIWATEYIKATKDIAGAAYMLGNTVQMVLKHYAHLLDAECEERAITWLQSRLA